MIFFINSYLWKNTWCETYRLNQLPNNKLELILLGSTESDNKNEKLRLIFPNETVDFFKEKIQYNKNMFFEDISLKKITSNTYCITKQDDSSNRHMYALLKSNSVPDDVWIETSMKDKITVLKHITPIDCEPDYGNYYSNIYLVKITLKPGEILPIYFSSVEPLVLTKHIVIYKDLYNKDYSVEEYLQTFIPLNKANKSNYAPLSCCCE